MSTTGFGLTTRRAAVADVPGQAVPHPPFLAAFQARRLASVASLGRSTPKACRLDAVRPNRARPRSAQRLRAARYTWDIRQARRPVHVRNAALRLASAGADNDDHEASRQPTVRTTRPLFVRPFVANTGVHGSILGAPRAI